MKAADAITATTYWCFISYRHADNLTPGRQWATWLHRGLEEYQIPPALVGAINLSGQPVPRNIFPVFRDEEELPADADLSTPILRALENSLGMVVICSPRARSSRFVDDEVRLFKRETDGARILGMVISGSPDPTGLAADSCLPDAYFRRTDARSNLVDLRAHDGQEGWADSTAHQATLEAAGMDEAEAEAEAETFALHREEQFLRIVAHILEVPPETLAEQHQRHQEDLRKARLRSRILWGVFALALLAAVGKGILFSISQGEAAQAATLQAETQNKVTLQKKAERSDEEQKARKAQTENAYFQTLALRRRKDVSPQEVEASLRAAAGAGQATAQYELGIELQGKANDLARLQEGFTWLTKSAQQGNASAMEALGLAYRDERGTIRNLTQAERWLRQAAATKLSSANFELSQLLKTEGRMDESLLSLSEAAQTGHAGAQHELAKTYLTKTPQPDIATARKWLEASAKQGFAPAIRELGLTYLLPLYGSVDLLEAIRWLQAAEAKGDREATQKLTQLFADESTIPKERDAAFRWHLARAWRGNAASQNIVGVAYRDGLNGPVNIDAAKQFLDKAVNSGLPDAQYNLGVLFGYKGKFHNPTNSFELMRRAAFNGNLQAMADIAKLFLYGWDQGSTGRQVAERENFGKPAGEAMGLQWLVKAAEGGHVASMFELGQWHLLKFEKSKAPDEQTQAQRWLTAAAEKNFPEAQRVLGLLLFPSNQQAGIEWIRKAAENGEVVSQFTLGIALRDGHGLKANRAEAIRWLGLAADKQFDEAELALGLSLLKSKSPKEIALAADWIRKAAEQGNFGAQLQLAGLLTTGKTVNPDPVEAYKWFLIASANTAASPEQKTLALKQATTTAARLTIEQRAESQQTATLFSPTKPQR